MGEISVRENSIPVNPYSSADNFNMLYKMGNMFANTALVPDNYRNKPMECAIAVDMANRMGVSPMMVMQNLYVVKGRPQWSGQACMSMIKAAPEFKNVRPIFVGEEGKDGWGCYIQAQYRSTGEEVKGTLITIGMAKAEGWYNKPGSKWLTMPRQMLAYRAASFFARVYIPNSLMGLCVEGEAEDAAPAEPPMAEDPFAGTPYEEVQA